MNLEKKEKSYFMYAWNVSRLALRLIIPAMDGFCDNCPKDFTNFADQARQIEEYVKENYNGHLDGLFCASQGGLMIVELLSRGNIDVDVAVTDGVYVAHQGKLSGLGTYWMMKYYKDHNKPPKIMDVMIYLASRVLFDSF